MSANNSNNKLSQIDNINMTPTNVLARQLASIDPESYMNAQVAMEPLPPSRRLASLHPPNSIAELLANTPAAPRFNGYCARPHSSYVQSSASPLPRPLRRDIVEDWEITGRTSRTRPSRRDIVEDWEITGLTSKTRAAKKTPVRLPVVEDDAPDRRIGLGLDEPSPISQSSSKPVAPVASTSPVAPAAPVKKTVAAPPAQQVKKSNVGTCVVCYDSPVSQCLRPCNHVCMCKGCTADLMAAKKTCPICSKNITETFEVYIQSIADDDDDA